MNITIKEIRIIDGAEYEYTEYDKFLDDSTPYSSLIKISTEEEVLEQEKQNRIVELKEIITNKNYLGDDVTEERTELRALLGL